MNVEEVNEQFEKLSKYYSERFEHFAGPIQPEICERFSCYDVIDAIEACSQLLYGGDPMLDDEITLSEWKPGMSEEEIEEIASRNK